MRQVYTLWNFRKEALRPLFAAAGDSVATTAAAELKLTEKALRENPKSYVAWHHRKWIVAQAHCPLDAELALVTKCAQLSCLHLVYWQYGHIRC